MLCLFEFDKYNKYVDSEKPDEYFCHDKTNFFVVGDVSLVPDTQWNCPNMTATQKVVGGTIQLSLEGVRVILSVRLYIGN